MAEVLMTCVRPFGALEPVEQPELIVGWESADFVQHQRAAVVRVWQRQLLTDAPPFDRFLQVEQERLEDEPDDAVRCDEEEIDARHPHQQEIDMRRPCHAPVIG